MLDSEHEISEQLNSARHVEHNTLNMYLEIYKHVLYSAEKNLLIFLLLYFF